MTSPLQAMQDDASGGGALSKVLTQQAQAMTPQRGDVESRRNALMGAYDKLIQAQQYQAPPVSNPAMFASAIANLSAPGNSAQDQTAARMWGAGFDMNDQMQKARQAANVGQAETGLKQADTSAGFLGEDQKNALGLYQLAAQNDAKQLQAELSLLKIPKVTKDGFGNTIIVNPATGEHQIISDNGTAGLPTDLKGEDFLKALPPGDQKTVKALAEGRMAFPSGLALKSPRWQQLLTAVGQYDPEFDAVNYNARAKTRNDFTSGKSAQNITAMNTAIGHLDTLAQAADKLENTSIPLWNKVANTYETAKGDPRVKNFNVARDAVKSELTRVFRGTGGNVADLKDWEDNLNAADSPEQLHNVIKSATELLGSRLDAVGDQYSKGMGKTSDPLTLLNPKSQKILQKLRGETASEAPAGTPAQPNIPPNLPPGLAAELERRKLLHKVAP